jgi:bis(5'-adenosyl)-triphosphatase
MYKFGKINLNCKQIFFESHFSIGIVNLMPLLPGHVLLIPKRIIKRYHQMDEVEISDLFISVKKVGKVLES